MLLLELMKLLKTLQKLWCKLGGLVLAEKLVTGKTGHNINCRNERLVDLRVNKE